jgi:4-amino-4-deoxy-L-arabinose transferase-like glycosyltransferase
VLVVLGVALALNLTRLGARSLLGDEAIYGGPARRAAVQGRWYPPLGRHAAFAHKPPLIIWLPASSFALLGVEEWSDRLPSALAGAAVAALVCGFAAWLLDPWSGALAGLLLATCRPWLFLHGVRDGVADPPLALLMAASLLCYLRYRTTDRRAWLAAAAAASAAGALLKGPVGPLLLLAITLAWEAARWMLALRALRAPNPAAAPQPNGALHPAAAPHSARALLAPLALFGLALVPLGVWIVDGVLRIPRFVPALRNEYLTRIVSGVSPLHVHGVTFYLPILARAFGVWWIGALPAGAALVRLWRQGGPRARAALLVPIWGCAGIACLQLSVSKLPWYVEPMLPAFAVLLAAGFGEAARWLARWPVRRVLFGLGLAGMLGARAAAAWETLAQPAHVNPMHRLALAVRREQPRARVYLDIPAADANAIREWNYYYLESLDDLTQPLPARLAAAPCSFVVSSRAPALRARREFAGVVPLAADRETAAEADLEIFDLCGGAVAREPTLR